MTEREKALKLLLEYNKEKFHIQHALTLEAVMKWYAGQLGHDADYWGIVGLLHDIDFEMYPKEHCTKAVIEYDIRSHAGNRNNRLRRIGENNMIFLYIKNSFFTFAGQKQIKVK